MSEADRQTGTNERGENETLRGRVSELEGLLARNNERLAAYRRDCELNRVTSDLAQFLIKPGRSLVEISRLVLESSKELTGSAHGYAASIDPETGANIRHAVDTLMPGGSPPAEPMVVPPGPDGTYPGLWGHALNTREAFFTNSPGSHGASTGVPERHHHLKNFLSVPALSGGRLLGQIALANSDASYSDWDLESVSLVARLYALAIERAQAEESLRQGKKRYRSFMESSRGIGFRLNAGFQPEFIHGPVEEITSYRPEEFLAGEVTWERVVHPDDRPEFRSRFALFHGPRDGSFDLEHRIMRRDGGVRWLRLSMQGVRDDHGTLLHVDGLAFDVTDRRLAEDMLRAVAEGVSSEVGESFFRSLASHLVNRLGIAYAFIAELTGEGNRRARTVAFCRDGQIAENFEFSLADTPCDQAVASGYCFHRRDVRRIFPTIATLRELEVESYAGKPLADSAGRIIGLLVLMDRKPMEHEQPIRSVLSIVAARSAGELERLRDEDRLRLLLAQWDETFNAIGDAISIIDPGGRLLRVNRAMRELLGRPDEETIGRPCWELMHNSSEPVDTCPLVRMLRTRRRETLDLPIGDRWYQVSADPIFDEEGTLVGAVHILSDFTERKKAADDLRASERSYQTLVEGLPDVIARCDSGGRFVFANSAVARLTGLSAGEFPGKTPRELGFPEEECDSWEDLVKRVLQDGVGVEAAWEYQSSSGSVIFDWRLLPEVSETGEVTGILAIGRDVTEKEHLEEQLRQSQKLEAVGLLAGGVAHDFNNLLTAIMGFANLLRIKKNSEEEIVKSAKVIEEAAVRAGELTRQLLGFARRGKLREAPVDMHQVVTATARILSRTIDRRVEVSLDLRADIPTVTGDEGQMEQVVMNLAVNARDAMPTGGRLTIGTALEELPGHGAGAPALPPGVYLVLFVADTGVGIAPEIRDRLFEPFFTTKERGRGTGMGLPMVYGIVANHGGAVTVESTPGRGSIFRVWIPSSPASGAAPKPAESPEAAAAGTGRILVADDEETVREVVSAMLVSLGYEVCLASDGQSALDLFGRQPNGIDLVLMDVDMPRLSGPDCAARMNEIRPGIPVVFATGHASDEAAREALKRTSALCIQKPFVVAQLAEILKRALGDAAGRESPTE